MDPILGNDGIFGVLLSGGLNSNLYLEGTVKPSSHEPPCRPSADFHMNKVGFSTLTPCPVLGVHYQGIPNGTCVQGIIRSRIG